MRAAAIARSFVKPQVVEPFCDARVNLFRGNKLEPNDLPDVAMVFGGDGAVHRVLPSLAHSETPLLVVPDGSCNDTARCLGILNWSEALRAWHRYLDFGDNVRTIDLGVVHPLTDGGSSQGETADSATYAEADSGIGHPVSSLRPAVVRHRLPQAEESTEERRMIYFIGIAGIGLDAETNRCADCLPGWLRRHGGYILAALEALADYTPPKVVLHCFDANGQETCLSGAVLFAAIGNAPEYGSGIRMLPQAQLDDGQLDLCFVPAMAKSRVLRHIYRIYSGTHLLIPGVRYFRTRQVFVESDEAIPIYADGEFLCQTPVEISASPRALRVIVP